MDWTTFDQLLKGYGLGIVTLGAGIWWLVREVGRYQKREEESQRVIVDLTKESLQSISQMTKVVESLMPLISGMSLAQKTELERTCGALRDHITQTSNSLRDHINAIHTNQRP